MAPESARRQVSSVNLLTSIRQNELGRGSRQAIIHNAKIAQRLDKECNCVRSMSVRLAEAVDNGSWPEIERVLNDVIVGLSEVSMDAHMTHSVSGKKKEQRECFALYGGIDSLLQIFEKKVPRHDARNLRLGYSNRTETWNEILVVLRDLIIASPSVVDIFISDRFVATLVTFISHRTIFDNAINLLEEILAVREESFPLSLVPNLYSLLDGLSARQLAHFCRVLSLVVFEPEDRHLMDGPLSPRSFDVLRLRRKRMSKGNNLVIERNQNIVFEMPGLIGRLVDILRVINYGPSLIDMLNNNIGSHIPISSDIMTFNSAAQGISDWNHFRTLISQVEAFAATHPSHQSLITDVDMDLLASFAMASDAEEDESMAYSRHAEITSIINIMMAAQSLGIARLTELGEALNQAQPYFEAARRATPGTAVNQTTTIRGNASGGRSASALSSRSLPVELPSGDVDSYRVAKKARDELQFHAMLLIPHQIELIFVLCTLLSGRRKIAIQRLMHAEGMTEVLTRMFDRMSWDAPPYAGVNRMEHIHGPNCECNQESAVRVQFLRLVHNYYDRDFQGNINKFSLLSLREQAFVQEQLPQEEEMESLSRPSEKEEGLLARLIRVLMSESTTNESAHRFWLSACVENYLRGCGRQAQLLVMKYGLLPFTVQSLLQGHMMSVGAMGSKSSTCIMQTAFDLLGEMIKTNMEAMEMLDSWLSEEDFRYFTTVMTNNLIDSNVFLRSLVFNVEIMQQSEAIVLAYGQEHSAELAGTSGSSVLGEPPNKEAVAETARQGDTGGGLRAPSARPSDGEREDKADEGGSPASDSSERTTAAMAPVASDGQDHEAMRRLVMQAFTSFRFVNNTLTGSVTPAFHPPANYLTDSWVMFDVRLASPTASLLLASPWQYYLRELEERGMVPSPKSMRTGLAGAITGAIRKATSHFLRFGESSPTPQSTPTSPSSQGGVGAPRMSFNVPSLRDFLPLLENLESDRVEGGAEETGFHTPPEGPPQSERERVRASAVRPIPSSTLDTAAVVREKGVWPVSSESARTTESFGEEAVEGRVQGGEERQPEEQQVPPVFRRCPRLYTFLQREKVSIVLKLLCVVSLKSVSHENICCVNTVLLIFLLDHSKGALAQTLAEVRSLARKVASQAGSLEVQGSTATFSPPLPDQPLLEAASAASSASKAPAMGCQKCAGSAGHCSAASTFCGQCTLAEVPGQSRAARRLAGGLEGGASQQVESRVNLVFENFREVLWYWREYYLRRGRDRLSIEFSCHIPFAHWHRVVELLCADDGSPTALLSSPIHLPVSPYATHAQFSVDCRIKSI